MGQFVPIASHIYRGNIIGRNPNRGALKWSCYCGGTFLAADTLAGMKALIREALA